MRFSQNLGRLNKQKNLLISEALFMYGSVQHKRCVGCCTADDLFKRIKGLIDDPRNKAAEDRVRSEIMKTPRLYPLVEEISMRERISHDEAFLRYVLGGTEQWHNSVLVGQKKGALAIVQALNCFVFPGRLDENLIRVFTPIGQVAVMYKGPSELLSLFNNTVAVHWNIPFLNITEKECDELKDKNRALIRKMYEDRSK